ncbi:MAG: acyl-[acyl-carrier-protein] thioesterase, partial [Lachnospiraceae bacterium]|nr:acyl-[acyl-carrier-protein] thioesterase [Lachnospiraceae bacterium]
MDDKIYEYVKRIGFSQCDSRKTLTLPSLVDDFQDCSTFQSEDLGVGYDFLEENDYLWVINYWEIDIEALPKLCDRVAVGTFPHGFKVFFGYRNFYLKDEKGNMAVKANSMWTLINRTTGKPDRIPKYISDVYVLKEKLPMTYGNRKVELSKDKVYTETNATEVTIRNLHLDSNGHVNNAQYIKLAMDALPETFKIKRLRIEYRMQALLG